MDWHRLFASCVSVYSRCSVYLAVGVVHGTTLAPLPFVCVRLILNIYIRVQAYTGQEKIYQKLYNTFGISNESLSDYFGGPAFLAWNRGQGLLAWGGKMDTALPGQPARPFAKGLPQTWIDAQWDLQREILPRMRAFGMKPVLPGFQGNVPNALHTAFPTANISRPVLILCRTLAVNGTAPCRVNGLGYPILC